MPYQVEKGIGIVRNFTDSNTEWYWNIPNFWTMIPNSVLESHQFQIDNNSVHLKVAVVQEYIYVGLVNDSYKGCKRKFSVHFMRQSAMLNSNSKRLPALGEICFPVSIDHLIRQVPPSFDLAFTLRAEPLIPTTINAEPGTSQVTDECVAGGTKKKSRMKLITSEETRESEKLILPKPKNLTNLANSYKQLLESEKNTDVILKVKGKDFKAHQCILTSRSPVLMSTFEHDMEEKRTGVVKIDDCDPESFYDFLLFLYAGHIEKLSSSDHVTKLYKTAHKYDVPDLREECVEYLRNNLTVENVCDVMNLALKYDEDKLNEIARQFFLYNATAVVETPQFGIFMASNIKVAQRLIADLSKLKK